MVRIVTTQTIYVQCDQCVITESLKKLVQQIHIKITDTRTRKLGMVLKPGTPGEVNYNT